MKENIKKGLILSSIFIALIVAMVLTVFIVPRGVNYLANVSLTSVFSPKEDIILSPSSRKLISGEILVLSWNGPIREDGVYSISYSCVDGITASISTGLEFKCGEPFFFPSRNNSVVMSFASNRTSDTDIPLYLNFKNIDDKTSIVGDTLITVKAGKKTIVESKETTKPTTPVIKPATKPTVNTVKETTQIKTQSDLVARVLSIGHIDSNNFFTPGLVTPDGNRPAIKFEVINIGDTISGPWTFKALLPSKTAPVYDSPLQPSLAKGDRVEFTLGFDIVSGGGDVYIFINQNRSVKETDYTNNNITYKLSGGSTNTINPYTSYGNTDLVITKVSTGYIQNDQLVESDSILGNQRAGIKFTVKNIGTKETGQWRFQATLPSRTEKTYTSKYMNSIVPGGSIEVTIGFDNIEKVGDNISTINLDFDNKIPESNENNNSISTNIKTRTY